ncbi:MAG TPA: hypothetical protein VHS31_04375 [Tepidisphaeraceae bacterium]|nr:hypothetical protein [Tepidisphaeraceae bacterium]
MDLDVLTAMLGVVPCLVEVTEQTEHNAWNQLWRQVVQLLVERARPPHSNGDTDDDQHNSLPYDDERDLLGLIARSISRMREDDQPELLWQPLLSLPDASRHWVEAFLQDWLSIPLRPDQIPDVFSREWARMYQFCSESAIWNSHSHERASLRQKLLGIGTIAARYWGSEHRDLVANMIDRYKTYADSELSEQSRLADFCTFLCYDAAGALLFPAIQWIAKSDWIPDPKNWWRDHNREAVCRFLNRTWNNHEATLRADAQALTAFRTILAAMTACREPIALELQDRMARGDAL